MDHFFMAFLKFDEDLIIFCFDWFEVPNLERKTGKSF